MRPRKPLLAPKVHSFALCSLSGGASFARELRDQLDWRSCSNSLADQRGLMLDDRDDVGLSLAVVLNLSGMLRGAR